MCVALAGVMGELGKDGAGERRELDQAGGEGSGGEAARGWVPCLPLSVLGTGAGREEEV